MYFSCFCVILHMKTTHFQRLVRYWRIHTVIDFASGHNKVVGTIWQSQSRSEVGCWRLDGVSVTWVAEVECWASTAAPHRNWCDPCIPGRFYRIVYRLDHQLARNIIQVSHETSWQLLKERKIGLTPHGHDIWVRSLVGLFEFRLYWDGKFELKMSMQWGSSYRYS